MSATVASLEAKARAASAAKLTETRDSEERAAKLAELRAQKATLLEAKARAAHAAKLQPGGTRVCGAGLVYKENVGRAVLDGKPEEELNENSEERATQANQLEDDGNDDDFPGEAARSQGIVADMSVTDASLAAEERAAKLAELRAQKAKLLEAKARAASAAKLTQTREHQVKLADLEDGRQRGLRGFALVEHADKLAGARQSGVMCDASTRVCEAGLVDKENVSRAVLDGKPEEEVNENREERATQAFLRKIGHQLEDDGNDDGLSGEAARRQQQSNFVASMPVKTKNVNRKGHHGRGSVVVHLATSIKKS